MDIAILAGGLGTRLQGVWKGPKCLVPIAGKPVLFRLLDRARKLKADKIHLLLGNHVAQRVLDALQVEYWSGWIGPKFLVNISPAVGTAEAIRKASSCKAPLLVLNGDTLPLYPLSALLSFFEASFYARTSAAVAWSDGRAAGAAVLSHHMLDVIKQGVGLNLDWFLLSAARYRVPGYFDIGTPEAYHRAQHLKGDPFDSDEDAV